MKPENTEYETNSGGDGLKALKSLQAHRSDTVRGWACVLIDPRQPATPAERLTWIRPYAADNMPALSPGIEHARNPVPRWAWHANAHED